jgi:hypothetical protein
MQVGSRDWNVDVDGEAMGAVALGKKVEVECEMLNLGQVTSASAIGSTSILFFTDCHATTTSLQHPPLHSLCLDLWPLLSAPLHL